jgi:CBS domain containing-hemolysin-like protein
VTGVGDAAHGDDAHDDAAPEPAVPPENLARGMDLVRRTLEEARAAARAQGKDAGRGRTAAPVPRRVAGRRRSWSGPGPDVRDPQPLAKVTQDLAQQRGVVADDERRMIQSVFELGDTPAREVMVPRTEMVWIEDDKTAGQATSLAVRSGHSRIPVIGENVDDIVGVVYLKDLVRRTYGSNDAGRDTKVIEVMRPAVFIPDSKPLDDLLREMQRDRIHMALLVDEYGATAGLITIEDVLEEIVGEIADEYDTDEVAPVESLGDNTFRVSARLPIEDVGELYDIEFDEDLEVDTVGGLLALELGRVPLPGAEVVSHGLLLRAEGGRDHRGRMRVGTVLVGPAGSDIDGGKGG